MIAFPSGVRVWLATGHTDMRKGFGSLAVLVQETLKRNPHAGDLYVFRGRQGDLLKVIWHDGQGRLPVHQAIGARPLSLAFDRGWGCDNLIGAIVLSSFWDRLANAAENLASGGRGISAAD
jgi:hypothetical protein